MSVFSKRGFQDIQGASVAEVEFEQVMSLFFSFS